MKRTAPTSATIIKQLARECTHRLATPANVYALHAAIDYLQSERDGLLETLRALLDASQRNQEHYSEEAHDIAESNARAAIAKATGESA